MKPRPRLLARIALFSALIYVLSWATVYVPNLNLIFFIVFSAGYLWGGLAGALVGAVGMGLWTTFNPYGPADIPVMLAQVIGAALGGLIGAIAARYDLQSRSAFVRSSLMATFGIACTVLFYLPVNSVDAWVYQPFMPRFVVGLAWASIAIGANAVIFPLLFGVLRVLYEKESRRNG